MNDEPFELIHEGQFFRILPPRVSPARGVILAVHGLTGNEYSMEVFLQGLRAEHWAILPRAPYSAKDGGFTWTPENGDRPSAPTLERSAAALKTHLDAVAANLSLASLPLSLTGFSQGAALILIYAFYYSRPGDRTGLLAGFLPAGLQPEPKRFQGRSFYIAHGSRDETIPVSEAYRMADFIRNCGGQVDFCVSDTGHKLNLACFKQLEEFLR